MNLANEVTSLEGAILSAQLIFFGGLKGAATALPPYIFTC